MTIVTLAMFYIAIGAVLFAHPRAPAALEDFDWRAQIGVFRDSLPSVLAWPLALWLWSSGRN
jgi:ribose/xylose/arabinose/galactoside ABC-type transport system permease subunit